jgi:hypothetical protein
MIETFRILLVDQLNSHKFYGRDGSRLLAGGLDENVM